MGRPTAQDALTEEELDRLLLQPNPRYPTGRRNLALLLIMADSGLRVGETVGLQTTDLVTEGGQLTHVLIRHGKNDKPGKIALTRRAAAKLGVWLQTRAELGLGNGPLFATISQGQARGYFAEEGQELAPGKPLRPSYVGQLVKRLARKAGIERNISPHTLRHSFATRLLRATGNIEVTRKALRHARIQTTLDIYAHLVQEDVDNGIRQLPGSQEYEEQKDEEKEREARLQEQIGALQKQLDALKEAAGLD